MCIFVYKLFAYSLYSIDLSPAGIIFFNQAWVFYDIQTSSNTQQTMFKIIWPICACWNSKQIVCAVWNTVQEKLLFYILYLYVCTRKITKSTYSILFNIQSLINNLLYISTFSWMLPLMLLEILPKNQPAL